MKKTNLENLWEKSTWSSFFLLYNSMYFFLLWLLTYLWCIKKQNIKFLWNYIVTAHILYSKEFFYIFFTFGAFRGPQLFFFSKMSKMCMLLKWVLEGLFLIETLKMGIIFTLHFPHKTVKDEWFFLGSSPAHSG